MKRDARAASESQPALGTIAQSGRPCHGASREAEKHEILITRHGKPAGVLIGFEREDQWFEYRLENDSLRRIEAARASLRAGRGVRLEDVDSD